jgi:hypothetical protein
MRRKTSPILLVALVVSGVGCTNVPDLADRAPWYEVPTNTLEEKAALYRQSTTAQVNSQGLLLYTAWGPSGWNSEGNGWWDYVNSHDVADAPAWQGRFMAAVALEMAVTGEDLNDLLLRLAEGLRVYYDITRIEGLFGRSYLADYTDEQRLPWMETQEQDPDKFWKQEADGRWWRTGLAKNHFLGACLGCGYPLALEKRGDITLRPDVRAKLLAVLLPAVRRFVENGYIIIDYDGKPTEFGDLRPNLIPKEYIDVIAPFTSIFGVTEEDLEKLNKPYNGFNIVLVLSILRSAGEHDPEIMAVFEKEAKAWRSGLKDSFWVLGFAVKKVGHWVIGKPSYSDMEAVGFAAMALYLWGPDGELEKALDDGLTGLWGYMRWERNPWITLPHKFYVDAEVSLADIEEDLRDFPLPEQKCSRASQRDDTDEVQPLCNRVTNSNYWKSSPFRRALPPHDPVANAFGSKYYFSGTDYLSAYWLYRYLRK